MATHESSAGSAVSRLSSFLTRYVFIAVFTAIETAALAVWLVLVADAPAVSQAAAIGLGVLFVGLLVEHVLTDVAVNGVDLSFPVRAGIFFSATETALWALWLVIAERVAGLEGFLVAGVVLAVLLVLQHSIEDNALRGRGLFSRLLNGGTFGFSVLEAAGATAWLVFVQRPDLVEPRLAEFGFGGVDPAAVGLGILAVALFVEHAIGVAFSRR